MPEETISTADVDGPLGHQSGTPEKVRLPKQSIRKAVTKKRPPLPEKWHQLCQLCREGRLFEVQEWFRTNKYDEPEHIDCRTWPMGIAIEKGFHSLIQVLLENGVPPDDEVLRRALFYENEGMVELLLKHGANIKAVSLGSVVDDVANPKLIRLLIESGADIQTGYPVARGLIRLTRMYLGIYKTYIGKYPQLQLQADVALRHFAAKGNLRGVSLLMWLGANPRAKVPSDWEYAEDEDMWDTALKDAAYSGSIDVIKRLKPDPKKDDLSQLLKQSLSKKDMALVHHWRSLGVDINQVDSEGRSLHSQIIWQLEWALDGRYHWYYSGSDAYSSKRFAMEWFASGAKWVPTGRDEARNLRRCVSLMSAADSLEFIKLLREKDVVSAEHLGEILDTPKIREHMAPCHSKLATLVPILSKWVKAEQRKQERVRQEVRKAQQRPLSPPPELRPRVRWNDPSLVRRLSDE